MNSVKWQDTKSIFRNPLHFYMPITNYQKGKLNKPSHLQLCQKNNNKIPSNTVSQGYSMPLLGKL